MIKNKRICVFLSASDVPEKYKKAALELIDLMAENEYALVYGGSERGLMKVAADRMREKGGKIVSVVSGEFREVWRKDVDEQIECANIPDRKKKLLVNSDAIIVLPGGTGTLDEYTEIVETKKWGNHNKPIILVNTDGFWDGLLDQYKRMQSEGFLGKKIEEVIFVTGTSILAIDYLNRMFTNEDK